MGRALRVRFASRSDVGRVRSSNQDAFGEFTHPQRGALLVVADGMGGHRGGGTASRLAIDVIGSTFEGRDDPPEALLRRAVEAANLRVHGRAARDAALEGMGTTVVMLWVGVGGEAWVAHVGDSRLYR
jgi:protein phosphatase